MRRARQKRWLASDKGKYSRHRSNALARGIEWHFDFDSWLKVWKESGHYDERGQAPGKYQMARIGDCGPYADWNVRIVRMEANAAAALLFEHAASITNPELRAEVASIL